MEPWSAFEDATADAFEFLLGVRVNRLGGKKRGKKVSDLVTHIPDPKVLVIDTKAYKNPFDASSGALRPLQEYTVRQRQRQGNGGTPLGGAIVVANDFKQDATSIATIAAEFIASTGVPVTFIRARTLVAIVAAVANDATLRRAIRWSHLFCRGGMLEDTLARSEKTTPATSVEDTRAKIMGTSSNQRSRSIPTWLPARAVLGREGVAPDSQSRELWRAALGDQEALVRERLSSEVMRFACELASQKQPPNHSIARLDDFLQESPTPNLFDSIAKRALARAASKGGGRETSERKSLRKQLHIWPPETFRVTWVLRAVFGALTRRLS